MSFVWKQACLWGLCIKTVGELRRFGVGDSRVGNRLFPSAQLFDLDAIDQLAIPAEVWFFRRLDDSAINNTSMLMDAPGVHSYGIKFLTLDAFVADGLHT